jgi:hypothetical protein
MNAPRLMFRYLGKRNAKSLEVAIELVEMLVPRVARPLVVSVMLFLLFYTTPPTMRR